MREHHVRRWLTCVLSQHEWHAQFLWNTIYLHKVFNVLSYHHRSGTQCDRNKQKALERWGHNNETCWHILHIHSHIHDQHEYNIYNIYSLVMWINVTRTWFNFVNTDHIIAALYLQNTECLELKFQEHAFKHETKGLVTPIWTIYKNVLVFSQETQRTLVIITVIM